MSDNLFLFAAFSYRVPPSTSDPLARSFQAHQRYVRGSAPLNFSPSHFCLPLLPPSAFCPLP